MMPKNNEDFIVFLVVTLWLLENGLKPTNDFDVDDPNCVRDNGRHRIWTFSATVPGRPHKIPDVDVLNASLSAHLRSLNKLYNFAYFPFRIDVYDWPKLGETLVYVSVYA